MSMENSSTGYAAANLLCSIGALGGKGITGKSGIGSRLAAEGARDSNGNERSQKQIWQWLNRAHSDERVKSFDNLRNLTFGYSDASKGPRTFQDEVACIIRESILDVTPERLCDSIADGLMRGCAMDEAGLRLLSLCIDFRNRTSNRASSGSIADELPPRIVTEFIESAASLIAGASGSRFEEGCRNRSYVPYGVMVRRGASAGGLNREQTRTSRKKIENCRLNDERMDELSCVLAPFAISASFSALYGGKLGWEGGSAAELADHVLNMGGGAVDKIDSIFIKPGNEGKGWESLIDDNQILNLKKKLGAALGEKSSAEIIEDACGDADEVQLKDACERILDGLVVSYFVPERVITSLMMAYDGKTTWKVALCSIIDMMLTVTRSWADCFSELSERFKVKQDEFSQILPRHIYGREDLINQVVDLVEARWRSGNSIGVKIALVGSAGCGRRTVAFEAARRLLESQLEESCFEVVFSGRTASETLASLSFLDERGLIDASRRRDENAEKLQKLPPRTLVIISGVTAGGISKIEHSYWSSLNKVGMADLIVTVDSSARELLDSDYIVVSVNDLCERDLAKIYEDISDRHVGSRKILDTFQVHHFSVADVVAQALIDRNSGALSPQASIFDPGSLRDKNGEMTAELEEMIRAALLPIGGPSTIVALLENEVVAKHLIETGWLDDEARLASQSLRSVYLAYCRDSFDSCEWANTCDPIAEKASGYLSCRLPEIFGNDPQARTSFRDEVVCVVSLLGTLAGITAARRDEGGSVRLFALLGEMAKWLNVLGETRRELMVREQRQKVLHSESDLFHDEDSMIEDLKVARLKGKLGNYGEAIADCTEVIKKLVDGNGFIILEAGNVREFVSYVFNECDLASGEAVTLVRALRLRGYITHDFWTEHGGLPGSPELDRAIEDKLSACHIAGRLDRDVRQIELARTLTTLAYSYHYKGDNDRAKKINASAIETFRSLAMSGGRDEYLELAAALNFQGFFLSADDEKHERKDLEEALDLKWQALEIREKYLPSVDMDLARSHNNLAITLRDLGRLSEAREHVKQAIAIRGKRITAGDSGHTLIDQNLAKINEQLARRDGLDRIIGAIMRGHQGVCSIYAADESFEQIISLRYEQHGHDAKMVDTVELDDEDADVYESGSTIKVFIDVVLQLLIFRGEIDGNQELEYLPEDYVGGSGILKTVKPGGVYRLSDVAVWMIASSDNIATNMIIRLIGVDRINSEIAQLGFRRTRVLHKLSFPDDHDFGQTTAKELGRLLLGLLKREGVLPDAVSDVVVETVLSHLKRQQSSVILAKGIPPYLLDTYDEDENSVKVLSKSGTMNDVRADAGIVITPWGSFVAVLMAKGFPEILEDDSHPSVQVLRKVSTFLFNCYSTLFLTNR